MRKRSWKTVQPRTLRQALELSIEYAREHKNLSVEGVAERIGLESHWALYKWMQNGRIPAVYILPLENVCGINLVNRWLSAASSKLLIDMPTGRNCTTHDTHELQKVLLTATTAILAFYEGTADSDAALGAIQIAMENLAWHRGNMLQHTTPQLELGDSDDE